MRTAQRRLDALDTLQSRTLDEERRLQELLKQRQEALSQASDRCRQARLRRELQLLREAQLQDAVTASSASVAPSWRCHDASRGVGDEASIAMPELPRAAEQLGLAVKA